MYDVLVDGDAERLRDDQRDPWTPKPRIARLEFDDGLNECLIRPLRSGLLGTPPRREQPAVLSTDQGLMKCQERRGLEGNRSLADASRTEEDRPESAQQPVAERQVRRPLASTAQDDQLLLEQEIFRLAARADIQQFPASCRQAGPDTPHRPRGVEQPEKSVDDRCHADYGPQAATLRSPPSASRPTHRRRDRRHRPRSSTLDGARLAGRDADGRGRSGCGGPHGAGAPTRGPEAAATSPQAQGTAPARARPAPNLGVSADRRASDGRARQDTHPARRGSHPRVSSLASGPAIPPAVAEPVPCLAPASARLCA
jgi:hypothetical protein